MNFNGHALFADALEDAAIGRDIAIVAADGDADEVGAGHAFVGGIETDPAGRGEIELAPGGGLGVAAIALAFGVEEAADVSGW